MLYSIHRRACALIRHKAAQTPWHRLYSYTTTSGKRSEPLRILFCGTDSVSIESLHALHEECRHNSSLVESVECVLLPPKPSGRGRKLLIESPMTKAAEALGLRTHSMHTFKDWELPRGINLIVAVSFGLFVPKRILRAAKYGGLNVHPSFLPDLRGPAPIHHAILRGDEFAGASLQTMHEEKFDHGTVLAQTPAPGLRVMQAATLQRVTRKLAVECADLLVQGLRDGVHVPPYADGGWKARELGAAALRHAPKVTKADMQVDWLGWTAEDWTRRLRVSQAVWTVVAVRTKAGGVVMSRIIFYDAMPVVADEVTGLMGTVEVEVPARDEDDDSSGQRVEKRVAVDKAKGYIHVQVDDATWLRIRRATMESRTEQPAAVSIRQAVVFAEAKL